jgi:hypothetical protein
MPDAPLSARGGASERSVLRDGASAEGRAVKRGFVLDPSGAFARAGETLGGASDRASRRLDGTSAEGGVVKRDAVPFGALSLRRARSFARSTSGCVSASGGK